MHELLVLSGLYKIVAGIFMSIMISLKTVFLWSFSCSFESYLRKRLLKTVEMYDNPKKF